MVIAGKALNPINNLKIADCLTPSFVRKIVRNFSEIILCQISNFFGKINIRRFAAMTTLERITDRKSKNTSFANEDLRLSELMKILSQIDLAITRIDALIICEEMS